MNITLGSFVYGSMMMCIVLIVLVLIWAAFRGLIRRIIWRVIFTKERRLLRGVAYGYEPRWESDTTIEEMYMWAMRRHVVQAICDRLEGECTDSRLLEITPASIKTMTQRRHQPVEV